MVIVILVVAVVVAAAVGVVGGRGGGPGSGDQCQFAAAEGGGHGLLLCWFFGCLVGSSVSWLVCVGWLVVWLVCYGLLVGCAAIQHALLTSLDMCTCML